jgi:hypothetical protein
VAQDKLEVKNNKLKEKYRLPNELFTYYFFTFSLLSGRWQIIAIGETPPEAVGGHEKRGEAFKKLIMNSQ